MGWAIRQDTGDCSSQFVLLLLSMRADEKGGMTEIDADYIAKRTHLGRATVFRCFRRLRELGLFETETRHSRSGGREVSGRLRLDVSTSDQAMREARGSEAVAATVEREGSLMVRRPDGEVVSNLDEGSLIVSRPDGEVVSNLDEGSLIMRRPSLCSNSLINNPPNPPAQGEAGEGATEVDGLDALFVKFQTSYPVDATMNFSEARRAFSDLSIRDRERAVRWAGEYRVDVEKRGATRALDAAKWLRQRRFDEIEKIKGGQAKARGLERPMAFVAVGTRAWNAWLAHKGVRSHPMTTDPASRRTGWWFASLWPPGVDPPPEGDEAVA